MHPSISLMLHDPRIRNAIERALAARGRHGDTMIAHISPAEALALKRMGGAGTVNPRTGLLQFWEDGGGAGNSEGHAGPSSGPGGGGGNSNGGDHGNYNGQGRGWGGAGDGTTGGDLGPGQTRSGESAYSAAKADYANSVWGHIFGAEPTLTNSASYADGTWHAGFNPGALAGGALGAIIGAPGLGLLTGQAYKALGGTDGVLGGPGAPASEGSLKGLGVGSGSNPYGGPGFGGFGNGSTPAGGYGNGGSGGRLNDERAAAANRPTAGSGAPSTAPMPAVPPAGLPPSMNPNLAELYYGGSAADPFAGRFGANRGLMPYLIAANQPQGGGFLSGLIR